MLSRPHAALAAFLALGSPPLAALAAPPEPGPVTLVVCAPGFPGSTAEAESRMEAFAGAVAAAAGQTRSALSAVYHETEAGGLERLSRPDAGFVFVPLAFFLKHEATLRLVAQAQAVRQGGEADEVFSLVAGKGKVASPAALAGWEILGTVAYAPRFVRGPVLGRWGALPASTKLVFSGAVLSGLRRAAAGEKVAVLLDGPQAAGLASLPYSGDLDVVARSAPLPASIVATVGDRVTPVLARAVVKALVGLGSRPDGASALADLSLSRFVRLDEAGLRKARTAYAAVAGTP